MQSESSLKQLLSIPVIVAALGYFVDIYDLLLFGIVRIPSLKALGHSESEIAILGTYILNYQMVGLLVGGIIWGVLGDKKGRLSVLFGSILTYSLANIACGFIQDANTYMVLRFIAGVGLAGELGAGITLVSEILPKNLRAIGTSLVASIGLLGAVVGYFTVEFFEWRTAYFVGGGMGILLLLLRLGVFESGIFKEIQNNSHVTKGNFFSLFTSWERFSKYMKCIGMGVPTWFVIGVISTFSNEFGQALGLTETIQPGISIMWCYIGLSAGDLASGFFSHFLESRKKAVFYMMLLTFLATTYLLFVGVSSSAGFYFFMLLLGFGIGYWAMFVTIGAEQFGTNLRATTATTVPNMVRGSTVIMTILFRNFNQGLGPINAGALVGLIAFIIGFYSILTIPETHNKDLDYLE
ncbi:MAG: hypothetical protein RIR51_2096 [Bacteroidota bacterium]|jgi:MFS family permease